MLFKLDLLIYILKKDARLYSSRNMDDKLELQIFFVLVKTGRYMHIYIYIHYVRENSAYRAHSFTTKKTKQINFAILDRMEW